MREQERAVQAPSSLPKLSDDLGVVNPLEGPTMAQVLFVMRILAVFVAIAWFCLGVHVPIFVYIPLFLLALSAFFA